MRYILAMGKFPTTRWSLIVAAAGTSAGRRAALAELCKLYWPPAYAFVRRSGHGPEDALDLTQSFFARMLEHNDLASFDPQRGRFRSWLLGALKNFLANERRHAQAQKRGGGAALLPIDALDAERRYAREPADLLTPERVYERRWALTLLEHVLGRLEQEHAAQDKGERFERLKGFLVGDEPSYEALASQLGESAGALRVQVHRLRRRYRDLLRDEIAETVEDPAGVDDELRHLLAALS
jgi:RNA polymerase sigma factor (sigma-70 family)